jgi:Bacterial EndoU nuclease
MRCSVAATSTATAGLFKPIIKWLKKKINQGGRFHHIFKGEVRRGPTGQMVGSGWHHRFMGQDQVDRRVVSITRRAPNGTYAARVEMKGPGGTWVPKPAGSTFFPDNWTPQQVVRSIESAFSGHTVVPGTNGRRWQGLADGVLMQGSFHPTNGSWNSAWPVFH